MWHIVWRNSQNFRWTFSSATFVFLSEQGSTCPLDRLFWKYCNNITGLTYIWSPLHRNYSWLPNVTFSVDKSFLKQTTSNIVNKVLIIDWFLFFLVGTWDSSMYVLWKNIQPTWQLEKPHRSATHWGGQGEVNISLNITSVFVQFTAIWNYLCDQQFVWETCEPVELVFVMLLMKKMSTSVKNMVIFKNTYLTNTF